MELRFHKMHGCGNDFIVIDDPRGEFGWDRLSVLAQRYCARRFAVGADGVIAVGHGPLPGESWPDGTDYEMRYLNADGSRAEMCGNGIRCVGKYVADVLGDSRDEVQVLTGNGVLPIRLHREAGQVTQVTVSMGVPKLQAAQIPTSLGSNGKVLRQPVHLDAGVVEITAVSMGNPHAVSFVEHITDEQIYGLGPLLERHTVFPQKTNVEFAESSGPHEIRMRVWERGCGETWACGTGACATVVAAVLEGRSNHGEDVTVHLNGGDLTINWPATDAAVQMTGPAEIAYEGKLTL